MGATENKNVALQFLEAIRKSDAESFLRLVSPDVVSTIPPSCERILGNPGRICGARKNQEAHAQSREQIYAGEVAFDIKHTISEANLVAVFLTIRMPESADQNDYVFLIRIENGRVAEWCEYLDTAHAFEQAGFNITKR